MSVIVEDDLPDATAGYVAWGSVIAGAIAAAAVSSVLLAFAAAIGLSVASASPTWRDTSASLVLLSGLYLLVQSLVAFGLGGYLAGRTRPSMAAPVDTVDRSDGLHGLLTWAVAVLIGLVVAAMVAGFSATGSSRPASQGVSAAEPVLSYELDRLFRTPRRQPDIDLRSERAEAGRILLTAAGHAGIAQEDRTFLVQRVGAVTGMAQQDAERRVDDVIGKSRAAVRKSRQIGVILAFSTAASLLLGSVAAWAAAAAGGRHRDGEELPWWMSHSNALTTRQSAGSAPRPLPE